MNRTRVRRGTERCSRPHVRAFLKIFAFGVAVLSASTGLASPAPVELKAKVVWVRGDRVYVASAESLAVEEGDVLRFRAGGKEIAAGSVVDVRDEAMIVASLTSGSFRKQKKLEKVRVLAERPPLLPLSSLRIGCPSRSRPCLLFTCEGSIGAALPLEMYRADTLSQRSFRFVRDTTVARTAPWPDTLFIRTFDESADEEIALEREDLDVAVFWPGELSTHIREDPRWRGFLYGTRQGGLGAKAGERGSFSRISPREALHAFDLLNRLVFRGDLAPYAGVSDRSASEDTLSADGPARVRIEANPTTPGSREINRALGLAPGRIGAPFAERVIYISYRPSLLMVRGGDPPDQRDTPDPNWTQLSGIRCPIVSDARLRATIRALGAESFANLPGCGIVSLSPR